MPKFTVKLFGQVTAEARIVIDAASREEAREQAYANRFELHWYIDQTDIDSMPEDPEIFSITPLFEEDE